MIMLASNIHIVISLPIIFIALGIFIFLLLSDKKKAEQHEADGFTHKVTLRMVGDSYRLVGSHHLVTKDQAERIQAIINEQPE